MLLHDHEKYYDTDSVQLVLGDSRAGDSVAFRRLFTKGGGAGGLWGVEDLGLCGPTPDPAPLSASQPQNKKREEKKKTLENTLDLL